MNFHNDFEPFAMKHAIISGLAVLGGAVSYIRRLRELPTMKFKFAELVGECAIAGFVGALAYMFCMAHGFDIYLTGAIVGISAHMGTRWLFLVEAAIQQMYEKRFGKLPGSK